MTREELIRNLKYTMEKHKNDNVNTFDTNISVMCKDILDYLEQEPKTGHWIVVVAKWGDTVTTVSGYRCSECNAFNTDEDNYCPNCGSKMQAESEVEHGKNES